MPNDLRNAQAPEENDNNSETVEQEMSSLTIVPNPNDGVFELSLADGCSIQNVTVIDALGKSVVTTTNRLENNALQLKLSNAKAGIYVVTVQCADGLTLQARLVVN